MLPNSRWLLVMFLLVLAKAAPSQAEQKPEPLIVADLGKGAAALDGPWQFHLGDDLAWAAPDFDDSRWEQLSAYKPWDEQGHWGYDGYAWYRRSIRVATQQDTSREIAVLIPSV